MFTALIPFFNCFFSCFLNLPFCWLLAIMVGFYNWFRLFCIVNFIFVASCWKVLKKKGIYIRNHYEKKWPESLGNFCCLLIKLLKEWLIFPFSLVLKKNDHANILKKIIIRIISVSFLIWIFLWIFIKLMKE